ncbi:MAG: ThiF family adenylyltransferase [Caldilineaceae bacterium]|nr:ThiF family adenylyltransferase [Caldilineaceae bacterium]
MPDGVYEEIRAYLLDRSPESESAGFVFVVPRAQDDDSTVFEYVEWFPVDSDSFIERSGYHLELTDEVRRTVIKQAHDLGASIVEFHSHTGSQPAAFSSSDHRGFKEFVPHVQWRLKKKPYFAVVVTRNDFDGLAWISDPKKPKHLDGIMAGGKLLKPTQLSSLVADAERYDRNIRFFGLQGQDALGAASVAVIGIGGLGTHVVQQLALLGVGRLVLIDPEEVDETNRNRYVGLRHDDLVPGMRKVDLGSRLAREINPEVEVSPIAECMRSQTAFEAIIKSDYVFGCLDNDGTRLILNELCLAYDKPYFDLASDILDEGARYGGRVCVVQGGTGCLVCYGELDIRTAQIDLMDEEQRKDHADIYGIPLDDLGKAGPSVVSLNGVIASLGVTEFMLMATRLPRGSRKVLKYRGGQGVVTLAKDDPDPDCFYCSHTIGKGEDADVQRYIKSTI